MAKDCQALAASVIDEVGGKDNIVSVTHCVTRLRFVLKDESKADDTSVKKTAGVIDVVHGNGQYQVVIGTDVEQAYDAAVAELAPNLPAARSRQGMSRRRAMSSTASPRRFPASSSPSWAASSRPACSRHS